MKLALAELLKTTRGNRVAGRRRMDVSFNAKPTTEPFHWPKEYEVSTTATFAFHQSGPEDEISEMHDRALKAIMREVYGEVEAELHTVQEEMWEAGLSSDEPPVIRLSNLIAALHGDI